MLNKYFLCLFYMKTFGSRAEVFHGTAKKTSGGLEKRDLLKNKHGYSFGVKKETLSSALGKNQINNSNLLTLPSAVYPSLSSANVTLLDAKTAINGSTNTVVNDVINTLDGIAVYTYNQAKCRRDVGLIVNALVDDLELGGDEFSTEVQGEYFRSYIQKYNKNIYFYSITLN
jgi:hypothetical protein